MRDGGGGGREGAPRGTLVRRQKKGVKTSRAGTEDQLWRDFPPLSSCQARHPSSWCHHARFSFQSVLIFTLSGRRGRVPRQISRRVDCDKHAAVAATARAWEGGVAHRGHAHSIWPGAGM